MYGLEISQQCGKRVNPVSQKALKTNFYFWRSYGYAEHLHEINEDLIKKSQLLVSFSPEIYIKPQRQGNINRLLLCTSYHMFKRAIWDKLPQCVLENFEFQPSKTRAIFKF